jgi:parallel beta-helix repeat protein
MSSRPQRFRDRAPFGRIAAIAVLVLAGLASTPDAEAGSGVSCGDRITGNAVLTKDLHCKKDGLKIGAHGIWLDLGGHDIIGPGKPGTIGIENPGFDRVVIDGYGGGAVRGFDRGIVLRKDARRNEIVGMSVHAGTYGLVQFDSCTDKPRDPAAERCGSRLDDNFITAGHGVDGYDGGSGAAFALIRSHDNYFEENYSWGNGVDGVMLDDSDRNEIGEFNFVEADNRLEVPAGLTPSSGTGLLLRNSDRNSIAGNVFAQNAKDGIFVDSESTENAIVGNLAVDNGRLGMNVRAKITDGRRNVAFGNGWSAQCRGVVCAPGYEGSR